MGIKVNVKKFSRSKVTEPQEQQPEQEQQPQPETNNEIIPDEDFDYNDCNFLSELNKTNYNESIEKEKEEENNIKLTKENLKQQEKLRKIQDKESLRIIKEQDKLNKEQNKITQIKNKKIIDNDNNSLFSETGNPINGREKNILLKKVKQYKNLFPTELSKFKIKVNATENELKNYLDEMEILVELDSVDDFLTDSILQSLKVIENVSATTQNYNISGLSDLLKNNKQFHTLCKQLYIKYNCFSQVPPEYQMMFLISTSMYICRNKNIKKNELNSFLNETINIPL
jgi:hypothetical protein